VFPDILQPVISIPGIIPGQVVALSSGRADGWTYAMRPVIMTLISCGTEKRCTSCRHLLYGKLLVVTRVSGIVRGQSETGEPTRVHHRTELYKFQITGKDEMKGTAMFINQDGLGVTKTEFTAERIPDLPSQPDLTAIKYGEPQNYSTARICRDGNLSRLTGRTDLLLIAECLSINPFRLKENMEVSET